MVLARSIIIRPSPSLTKPVLASFCLHLLVIGLFPYLPKLPAPKTEMKVVWIDLPPQTFEAVEIKNKIKVEKAKVKSQDLTPSAAPKPSPPPPTPIPPPPKPLDTTFSFSRLQPKPAGPPILPESPPKKEPEHLAMVERPILQEVAEPPERKIAVEKPVDEIEKIRLGRNDPEFVTYQGRVRSKIIREWILPSIYRRGPNSPKGKMVIRINQQGEIVLQSWEAKSGIVDFDTSCELAVDRASPLPIPPDRLKWEVYQEGFLVVFDPSLK